MRVFYDATCIGAAQPETPVRQGRSADFLLCVTRKSGELLHVVFPVISFLGTHISPVAASQDADSSRCVPRSRGWGIRGLVCVIQQSKDLLHVVSPVISFLETHISPKAAFRDADSSRCAGVGRQDDEARTSSRRRRSSKRDLASLPFRVTRSPKRRCKSTFPVILFLLGFIASRRHRDADSSRCASRPSEWGRGDLPLRGITVQRAATYHIIVLIILSLGLTSTRMQQLGMRGLFFAVRTRGQTDLRSRGPRSGK